MIEAEKIETVHLFVVRENDLPPPPDYLGKTIALLSTLVLISIIGLILFSPKSDPTVFFHAYAYGFSLSPVQKSITIKTLATGKRYMPPTNAKGMITFFNGQIYTQIIPVGTILKGREGVSIVTDTEAIIPPAAQTTPPTYGETSVPAHALNPGIGGNIIAGDINEACCASSIIAQNPYNFTGGRDEEHFTYLTGKDISNAINPILPTLIQGAEHEFNSSIVLKPNCTSEISSNPSIGQRAVSAKATLTLTCTAISYNPQIVEKAINAYSRKLGRGTLINAAYQVIEVDKNMKITFFVSGVWKPFVVGRGV